MRRACARVKGEVNVIELAERADVCRNAVSVFMRRNAAKMGFRKVVDGLWRRAK